MFFTFNLKKPKKILLIVIFMLIIFCGIKLSTSILFPLKHIDIIIEKSKKYNLNPAFVCAIIHAESRFNKNAVSPKGASGLMQIIEPTAYWAAEKIGIKNFSYKQILNPEINIEIGCWYISHLLAMYKNDKKLALAAYNAGSGNVTKWLNDERYSNDKETLIYIPFRETRKYINKVLRYEIIYKYLIINKV